MYHDTLYTHIVKSTLKLWRPSSLGSKTINCLDALLVSVDYMPELVSRRNYTDTDT